MWIFYTRPKLRVQVGWVHLFELRAERLYALKKKCDLWPLRFETVAMRDVALCQGSRMSIKIAEVTPLVLGCGAVSVVLYALTIYKQNVLCQRQIETLRMMTSLLNASTTYISSSNMQRIT